MLEGVAPVLDAEVAPRRLVVGLGDVSDREDPRRARPHGGVRDDPVVYLQAGLRGEPDTGRDAGSEEDGLRVDLAAVIEAHCIAAILALDALDPGPQAQVHAVVA